jgi:hypothetical protein
MGERLLHSGGSDATDVMPQWAHAADAACSLLSLVAAMGSQAAFKITDVYAILRSS